jgi:hypothetical protein
MAKDGYHVETARSPCEFREAYLRSLGINGPEDASKRLKAFEIAHDIRKFEISLYWQRSTYFWAFQVAAFAALGIASSESGFVSFDIMGLSGDLSQYIVAHIISMFGFVSAFLWMLVTKGSKRWQDNWERHVDLLETEFTGDLYKVHVGEEGVADPPFSVSKINELFASLLSFAWLTIAAIFAMLAFSKALLAGAAMGIFLLSVFTLLYWALMAPRKPLRVRMSDHGRVVARYQPSERQEQIGTTIDPLVYVIKKRSVPLPLQPKIYQDQRDKT